jgi:hypothetical protein
MNNLIILYKNLHVILLKEISKLMEYIEEIKIYCHKQDTKLNEIVEKTTNIFQGYQLIEYEINNVKKIVIEKGEKITSTVLNTIFKIKNPNNQVISIMKIIYEILTINVDIVKENSINEKEEINWEFLRKKIDIKYIMLLLSFITETSNLNISKEIMENATPIIKNDQYKNTNIKSFPEIIIMIDFIEVLMVYYTKLTMLKKLYISNKNKNNKLETIQSEMDKQTELMKVTQLFLEKIKKDYENYKIALKNKDKNNRMIYGYNILEKYSLYEKYIVSEEFIPNNEDYNSEYYNSNYGGNTYNNLKKKKRYVIKLDRKYSKKEKFIQQLSASLITYTKGIRKINRKNFIKAINEYKNTSVNKNSSNNNSLSKSKNKNNISINISTNNILMRSTESNNSSFNLKGSFLTNPTNSIFNITKINNSPFRNENSRNTTNSILNKKSFIESYPTFDNFYQMSNRNMPLKDGLNISSNECDQTTNKTILNTHEINSVKSNKEKEKKRNNIDIKNNKKKEINLKLEDEQTYSFCSICCKNMERKIGQMLPK